MQICFMSRRGRTRTSHGKLREKLLGEEKRKEKENRVFYLFFCYFFFSSFYPLFWENENRNPNRKDRTKFGKDELNKYEK